MRFHAKSNPNDTEDVVIAVNGQILQLQREQEVVVAGRFLEACRNATRTVFRQLPGQDRKTISKIMTYPFDIIGAGTEADYNQQKREGTKKNLAESQKAQGN